ncbi:MAG: hypothetical protein WD336_00135, partial [Trueperaceae bacterium]
PALTAGSCAPLLRGVHLAVFGLQVVVALAIGVTVAMLTGAGANGAGAADALMAAVLIVVAAVQVAIGVAVAHAGVRATRRAAEGLKEHDPKRLRALRSSALTQTVLVAVLLATPAWFAGFAVATGQPLGTLAGLAGVAAVGYGAGVVVTGQTARAATPPRSTVACSDASSTTEGDPDRGP